MMTNLELARAMFDRLTTTLQRVDIRMDYKTDVMSLDTPYGYFEIDKRELPGFKTFQAIGYTPDGEQGLIGSSDSFRDALTLVLGAYFGQQIERAFGFLASCEAADEYLRENQS